MELQQAIALIQNKYIISGSPQVWADLGCGSGLFTKALANELAAGSIIYAVDENKAALQQIESAGNVLIKTVHADFANDQLGFQNLNGVLMANALHFVKDKIQCIQKLAAYCSAQHSFLMVEYDTDTPNPWVPYPLAFASLKRLFEQCGYTFIHKINEMPSRYNRSKIYSAIIKP
jgi:trans-aconitate methyltransferase